MSTINSLRVQWIAFSVLSLSALCLNFPRTHAAPGDLDPTFGKRGTITTPFGGPASEIARGLVVQPDSKTVLVGYRYLNSDPSDSLIARYNSDGTLDSTFDGDGAVQIDIGGRDQANAVVLQPDGKIVVAGWGYNTTATIGDMFVLRLNPDGSIDTNFGTNGKTFIDFAGFNDYGQALVLQPDGKFLLCGITGTNTWNNSGLARLNADGSLDTGFGNGGKVITSADPTDDGLNTIALQSDGKIVAAGYYNSASSDQFLVARYLPTGALDTTFDNDGLIKIPLGAGDRAYKALVQPDGKVVVAGVARMPTNNEEFAVMRFNSDGSFDNSFSTDGKVTVGVGTIEDAGQDAYLQPDGKLIVSGYTSGKRFCLVRFLPDGSLDPTFGISGFAVAGIDFFVTASSHAMGILPSGKFVLGGEASSGVAGIDFALASFDQNGNLDQAFGPLGRVTSNVLNQLDSAKSVTVRPDGKIVTVGSSLNPNTGFKDFSLTRHLPDGGRDTTLGTSGTRSFSINAQNDEANNAVVQPDGKIVLVGYAGTLPQSDLAVMRITVNGALDSSFGTSGKVVLPIGFSTDIGYDIAIQPDGKLVMAGSAIIDGSADFVVVRLNTNGTLDNTFDADGVAITSVSAGDDRPGAVAIQSDGKILVVGDCLPSGVAKDIALARYNPDGSLDAGFGNGGKKVVSFGGPSFNETVNGIALQNDGKFVIAGSVSDPTIDLAAARFNADGTVDTTFSVDGFAVTSIAQDTSDEAFDVVVQRNGKIIIAGVSTLPNAQTNVVLARYTADGSLDPTFNDDGVVVTDYGNSGEMAQSVALQADGNIVVAGSVVSYQRREFALWRYLGDSTRRTAFDFDGDSAADISVFRPSSGEWYILRSQAGLYGVTFGAPGDKIAPADYDGDGKTDVAIYRPSNSIWYVLNSSNSTVSYYVFGVAEDLPTPADYDGDGKADLSVFRSSSGTWFRLNSSDNSFVGYQFGQNGDRPAVGDFDGDGKADISIYRPADGTWYRVNSGDGILFGTQFGAVGDLHVPADYDGDAKTDISVFRPSNGVWYRLNSGNGSFVGQQFGSKGDIPAPGDFDGDGKADVNVFRPSDGNWYRLNSSNNAFVAQPFGANGDLPTPAAFR